MEALINLAIQETNEAFVASGVQTQLRLVHAYHPTYVEDGGKDESDIALDHLSYGTGGMADVHVARDTYGADMVAMIVHVDDYCGVAWLGGDFDEEDHAFSVTDWSCATGSYTFGHELGHNFGCNHDRGTEDECRAGGYNYGYRDQRARFRSILAYDCERRECDDNDGGDCMRAKMFSTPDFLYNGNPIGTAESDCARRINDVRANVAQYRAVAVDASAEPSQQPSNSPSGMPSEVPSSTPSSQPSMVPSSNPTAPTPQPTTGAPSSSPSKRPTGAPTEPQPSSAPSSPPSGTPSLAPSAVPSSSATTAAPSATPSKSPSQSPSLVPSGSPSMSPSTSAPSTSMNPSSKPSVFPSEAPSSSDCAGSSQTVCGYSLDDEGKVFEAFHSVCLYDTDEEVYFTQCMPTEDLEDVNEGDFLEAPQTGKKKAKKQKKGDSSLVIHACGCCEALNDDDVPEYCMGNPGDAVGDPMTMSTVELHHCDEDKEGKLKVEFCFYDTSKGKEKRKCKDPFDLGIKEEDMFYNWGSCDE